MVKEGGILKVVKDWIVDSVASLWFIFFVGAEIKYDFGERWGKTKEEAKEKMDKEVQKWIESYLEKRK